MACGVVDADRVNPGFRASFLTEDPRSKKGNLPAPFGARMLNGSTTGDPRLRRPRLRSANVPETGILNRLGFCAQRRGSYAASPYKMRPSIRTESRTAASAGGMPNLFRTVWVASSPRAGSREPEQRIARSLTGPVSNAVESPRWPSLVRPRVASSGLSRCHRSGAEAVIR